MVLSVLLCLSALPLRAQAPASVSLAAVGDIRLDGPAVRAPRPGAGPLDAVRPWLEADIVFGNLETAVTERGARADKKWAFRAPAGSLGLLAGFNALNLANNHVMDFGPEGLSDTLEALRKVGIPHFGAGPDLESARKALTVQVRGLRVGFLGLTSTLPEFIRAGRGRPGVAYSDFGRFPDWIREAKEECDVLIVSFHGGTELAEAPNAVQRRFARAAVDAGADLVLGHHPHVLQAVELYKGKPILHSLGNFLFVSPTPSTRWSALARIELGPEGARAVGFLPVETWGGLKPAGAEGRAFARAALDGDGALRAAPGLLRLIE